MIGVLEMDLGSAIAIAESIGVFYEFYCSFKNLIPKILPFDKHTIKKLIIEFNLINIGVLIHVY